VSRRLLVATANAGKQREFRRLLAHLPAEIVTPDEIGLDLEVEEPHPTYAENAAAKADAYARASGLLSLADDSGIEVAALDWGPGVRSARWGGATAATPIGSSRPSVTRPIAARGWSARSPSGFPGGTSPRSSCSAA